MADTTIDVLELMKYQGRGNNIPELLYPIFRYAKKENFPAKFHRDYSNYSSYSGTHTFYLETFGPNENNKLQMQIISIQGCRIQICQVVSIQEFLPPSFTY